MMMRTNNTSQFVSIDESMVKFNERYATKQYLPLKQIKKSIKFWQRCEGLTRYVYDLNIYPGNETEQLDRTLIGGRMLTKLC